MDFMHSEMCAEAYRTSQDKQVRPKHSCSLHFGKTFHLDEKAKTSHLDEKENISQSKHCIFQTLTYSIVQRTVHDWLHLIKMVAEARKFDFANQLYAQLLSILGQQGRSDFRKDDAENFEKVNIAWVLALSSTFNDVSRHQTDLKHFSSDR